MKNLILEILESVKSQINAGTLLKPHLNKLCTDKNLAVLSIGKASNEMAKTVSEHFSDTISSGLIICPDSSRDYCLKNFLRYCSAHPFPDQRSIQTASIVKNFLQDNQHNYVLILISGGSSALIEELDKDLSLELYNELMKELLTNDFDINQINTLRKHLSFVKGGHLLQYLNQEQAHVFILSDIFSGQIENVGSGLFFEDKSTLQDALNLLTLLKSSLNSKIEKFLHESPKLNVNINYTCIADNTSMLNIFAAELNKRGINNLLSPYRLNDYACMCGLNIGCQMYRYKKYPRPFAVLYGGESFVKLKGDGKGGRCQEIALAITIELQFMQNVIVLAYATDGKDGNSAASGAIVDTLSYNKISESGFNAEYYLKNNDSYSALKYASAILDDHLSFTNLNDLVLLYFY